MPLRVRSQHPVSVAHNPAAHSPRSLSCQLQDVDLALDTAEVLPIPYRILVEAQLSLVFVMRCS